MEAALERFTRLTGGQRGVEGKIRLALILDPSSPQIIPSGVPGMLHVPVREKRPQFGLLHAKVAVLLFRRADESEPTSWNLRLIVSTGNWTRETVDRSIDLYWFIEIARSALEQPTDATCQHAADFLVAWDFLSWILRECCGHDPKEAKGYLSMLGALEEAIQALKNVPAPDSKTRFFDNRREALIDLVIDRANALTGLSKRNYLALGSGFFSGANSGDDSGRDAFETIEAIRKRLVETELLTKKPELDLVVNRGACQGVAAAGPALRARGWTIRPPSYLGQMTDHFLHAKFVFSALDNDAKAARPWLYLGSGNITQQGFMNKASAGNLEAGVVIHLKTLNWRSSGRRGPSADDVGYALPLQWSSELSPAETLSAGEELENAVSHFLAPPVSFFTWEANSDGGWLFPGNLDDSVATFDLLDADGRPCAPIDGRYLWPATQPRQVTVRWNEGREAVVPVIGQDGRIAGAPLRSCQITELWGELEGFPEPPNVEEDNEGDDPDGVSDVGAQKSRAARIATTSTALIRSTMDLVEKIAARQTQLRQSDWDAWLFRLEQTLMRAVGTLEVAELQTLKVNPLSPLRHGAYRPAFARADEKESRSYEEVLSRIEVAWNIDGLRHIGAEK
jgi:hypothetical protein